MSLNAFPIEIIEKIVYHLDGASFARYARVCDMWCSAKRNVERNERVWLKCCRLEMETDVCRQLSAQHCEDVSQLSEERCRAIYARWWSAKQVGRWPLNQFSFNTNVFKDNDYDYENIRVIQLTGTLLIAGHRSGRVSIIDYYNDIVLHCIQHSEPITGLALIDLLGYGYYSVNKNYRQLSKCYSSYSAHHHCVSISKDNRIKIFPIRRSGARDDEQHELSVFEINTVNRTFVNVSVCGDILAVSAQDMVDISFFRLSLHTAGQLREHEPLKVELLRTIACREVVTITNNWLGLFTFSDFKLKCLCNQTLKIGSLDMKNNDMISVRDISKDKFCRFKWDAITDLNDDIEFHFKNIKSSSLLKGFAFRDGIFIMISRHHEVFYTCNGQTIHSLPLHDRLETYDYVLCISLFGGLIACGTNKGYVYVYECPNSKRLTVISHYKPLFWKRVANESIVQITISCDDINPIVAAATKKNVFVFKWTPDSNETPQQLVSLKNGVDNISLSGDSGFDNISVSTDSLID